MMFNINQKVKVKLRENGLRILKEQHENLQRDFPSAKIGDFHPPEQDTNGWSEWQLWVLMETFGPYIHIGMGGPFETEIEILENSS